MRMKAFSISGLLVAATALRGIQWKPTTSPRPAAPAPCRKRRREASGSLTSVSLMGLCSVMAGTPSGQRAGRIVDGGTDAHLGGAAADIALHRLVAVDRKSVV